MATQLFAVTGNPILHSKSPLMFNAQFVHDGRDAKYLYLAAHSAEEAMFLFRQLGLQGMNVTSPFKEKIAKLLDVVHDEAKVLGSVNTVVLEDGKIHGYNTDCVGVTKSFENAHISICGKKCLVIGSGGAGKAAAYGLHSQGANVIIVNRTFQKARQAANTIGCAYSEFEELQRLVEKSDIIVMALPQNINPIPKEWLASKHIIFDANYKHSTLVEMARQQGCTIVSAEDWLLNQAVASYELFLHEKPNILIMQSGLSQKPKAENVRTIASIGIMGAGKTTISQHVADISGYPFVDIDDEIVRQEGRSITDIFAQDGETYFRKVERDVLQKYCQSQQPSILSCGGGIILHEENRKMLKNNALVLWLYATPETIIKRTNLAKRPLLQGENPQEKLNSILETRRELYEHVADVVVCSEQGSKQHTAELIATEIEKIWRQK